VSNQRSLARDMGASVGRHLVSVVVGLLMTPILVRSIGVARMGFWSLLGTSAFLVGLSDLGLTAATLRIAAGDDPRAAKRAARLASLVTAVVSIPLVLGCGAWLFGVVRELPPVQWKDARVAVALALVAGIVNAAFQPARAYAQGQGRLVLLAKARTVGTVAQLVVTLFGLWIRPGLIAAAAGYATCVVAEGAICLLATLDGVEGRGFPTRIERRGLFAVGRSALLTNMSVALCIRADVLVLQRIATLDVIGAYSVASRVVDQGFTLVKQVSSALVPRLGQRSKDRDSVIRFGTMLLGAIAAAPLAALAVAGAPLVVLWAGHTVDQPILPVALAWLSVAAIVTSIEEVACSSLSIGGDYRLVSRAILAGTLTNVALSIVGGWALGPGAVAAATAIGNVVMTVLVWQAIQRAQRWAIDTILSAMAPAAVAASVSGLLAALGARAVLHPAGVVGAASALGLGAAFLRLRAAWRAKEPVTT
jgi:O-antigen/teichoic acid export membrane protein